MSNRIRVLFIVGGIFIILLPAILTFKWSDFSDIGQIGDTVGVIMRPFVGILGACYTVVPLKRTGITQSSFI